MKRRVVSAFLALVTASAIGCIGDEGEAKRASARLPGSGSAQRRDTPADRTESADEGDRVARRAQREESAAEVHPRPPGDAAEQPVVLLEEEVEVVQDVPKGTDLSDLSNKILDSTSSVDAYGVGGGAAGAYGQRFGRGRLAPPPPPENRFREARGDDLRSTFSIDVDTAAYANVRRFLTRHALPPARLVRVEELINYFDYGYAQPTGKHPFSTNVEVADCPWAPDQRLVRIGLQGRKLEGDARPPSNLVFLIDVSGSMRASRKLPLLKRSLKLLVEQLGESDRVALVVYASGSGLVLPSTPCDDRRKVLDAIDRLEAGGSTNGGAGIELAYQAAIENYVEGGVNRVLLATDGDWNVGPTRSGDLERLIAAKAKSGVFLSVLGFGLPSGDSRMETLADEGNGNYASIDSLREARKALVEGIGGTLVTIAKDVKVQVEFDPAQVSAYRLVGYENRVLANEDFVDDSKDAGEIGAGHTVTALYQVALTDDAAPGGRLLTLRLRYKQPDGDVSTPLEEVVFDREVRFEESSSDLRFATAVAGFGLLLRESKHKGTTTWDDVARWAADSQGSDARGYRGELLDLVDRARALALPSKEHSAAQTRGARDRG